MIIIIIIARLPNFLALLPKVPNNIYAARQLEPTLSWRPMGECDELSTTAMQGSGRKEWKA